MTIEEYERAVVQRFHALLTESDKEMLTRFYLDGQSPEKICREMEISMRDFEGRKARARAMLTCGLGLTVPSSYAQRFARSVHGFRAGCAAAQSQAGGVSR